MATENGESDRGVVESRPDARHTAAGGQAGTGFCVVPAEGEGGCGGLGWMGSEDHGVVSQWRWRETTAPRGWSGEM